ncbi:MAG TPA: polysaccharide deacetylase family protein [Streptosporangiaceae bacterium]|nr:polysaccharide deacetylase family protein [Streptosporangiaceae bacterium]
MARRARSAFGRLLLNWGVLVAVVATLLLARTHANAVNEAPLPAPRVHLSAAATRQWAHFPSYTGSVPVVVYHGINDSGKNFATTPQLFAEQMLALKTAGFHAITLAQYAAWVHGDRHGLPSRPILLTFDDGRRDAYRVANNLLARYGFHATMFTFGAWPKTNPGFSLTWNELQHMQRSSIWSVQEHGGRGHEYVPINAAGQKGGDYADLRYVRKPSGGHIETFPEFVKRFTTDVTWGQKQFAGHIPGYRPLAFAVPYGDYGQLQTNDPQIPAFTLKWLDQRFTVVFGGDYLADRPGHPAEIAGRFSPKFSYRMTMRQAMQLPALYCRLKDWVTNAPVYREYRCMHLGAAAWGADMGQGRGQYVWHPPEARPAKGPKGHRYAGSPTSA